MFYEDIEAEICKIFKNKAGAEILGKGYNFVCLTFVNTIHVYNYTFLT